MLNYRRITVLHYKPQIVTDRDKWQVTNSRFQVASLRFQAAKMRFE